MCAVGARRRGQVDAGAQERCGKGREATGDCSRCSVCRLRRSRTTRGCSTRCWARAPGRRHRTRRYVGGSTSCCSLRRGAGRGWRSSDDLPADDEPRRPAPKSAPPDDELGGDHLVAGSKENIGLSFKAMGKKSEARQMFTEAARIRRTVLGADHLLTKKSERLAAQ